eukprot:scaffold159168_cov35-Tisochrysis_lutea.AAC.2
MSPPIGATRHTCASFPRSRCPCAPQSCASELQFRRQIRDSLRETWYLPYRATALYHSQRRAREVAACRPRASGVRSLASQCPR